MPACQYIGDWDPEIGPPPADNDGDGIHQTCDVNDSDPYDKPGNKPICDGQDNDSSSSGPAEGGCKPPPASACPHSPRCAGDPVSTYSGAFVLDRTDMGYPAPSIVQLPRSYDSTNQETGSFGTGFSSAYDLKLSKYTNGLSSTGYDFLLILPGGSRYILQYSTGAGAYVNTDYPFLNGVKGYMNGDSTYSLVYPDSTTYDFDTLGSLVEVTGATGNVLDISRDTNGFIDGVSDSFGRSLTVAPTVINGTTLIGSVTDALSREVTYTYNTDLTLDTVTYPNDSREKYHYQNGVMNAVGWYDDYQTSSEVLEVVNTYTDGRVTHQEHADGGTFDFFYTVSNEFVTESTVTDPRSNTTTYKFSDTGYMTQIVDPDQNTIDYTSSGGNMVDTVNDKLSRDTSYTYTSAGLVNSITDPAGNTTYYYYLDADAPTRASIINAPEGMSVQIDYDADGKTVSLNSSGQTNPVSMTYTPIGLINTITNQTGETVTYGYDQYGMLNSVTNDQGETAYYEYDAIGRITKVTDPLGNETAYAYSTERQVLVTDALENSTTYTYNGKGQLKSVTDARNNTRSFTYDVRDRRDSMTDQLSDTDTYDYNLNDNWVQTVDRKGQITNVPASGGYDALNRLKRVDYDDASYTALSYDVAGRVTQVSDSVEGDIDIYYTDTTQGEFPDKVGIVNSPQGNISYAYDDLGRKAEMTAGGKTVSYTYTDAGLLNSVSLDSPGIEFVLSYDDAGRRTGISYPNGTSATYIYNSSGVLTDIEHSLSGTPFEDLAYSWGTSGLVNSVERTGISSLLPGIINATYNGANRMLTLGEESLSYDDNGNLTSWGTMSLTWDVRDRLIAINGPVSASFTYDAFDNRIEKTIDGVTATYLYDGQNIVQMATGGVTYFFVHSLDIDDPLAMVGSDGSVRYFHADILGSVIALTDGNGMVKTQYNYSPFGDTEVIGEASPNPFQFTGRENDGATGMYYYRARYYSPGMRRFISEDPIGYSAGDVNFYRYVGNDPVNYVDPSGTELITILPITPGPVPGPGTGTRVGKIIPCIKVGLMKFGCKKKGKKWKKIKLKLKRPSSSNPPSSGPPSSGTTQCTPPSERPWGAVWNLYTCQWEFPEYEAPPSGAPWGCTPNVYGGYDCPWDNVSSSGLSQYPPGTPLRTPRLRGSDPTRKAIVPLTGFSSLTGSGCGY